ncbi:Harbinger transposase-derived nuclease domain [Arabidopsis thaliana x Arabidopsis arenosa]|uniref:Harbinger transposase-derived nuclease domain n=1 Tax=Arabidopsis thaliana x Arabidopsis arenosa TaxID=1240361 RepID=A0A8T2B0B1_9BRAS|nr:Harbinger transposase-derived nuclease domain [Arabidopsis thaliana x Arabidopsis arenosa]
MSTKLIRSSIPLKSRIKIMPRLRISKKSNDESTIEDLTNWYHGNTRMMLRLFIESQKPDPTCDWRLMRLDRDRGWRHTMQIMRGSNRECYETVRMNQETFLRLCNTLKDNYGLIATRECALEEAVAMCLEVLGHGQDQRIVATHFQRAQETVKRKFHEVLDALLRLADDIVKPKENDLTEVNSHLSSDSRYYPFFSDCIGALDGTHVKVRVRMDQKNRFWNSRKQYPSMNVLAICNFDMKFVYAYVGTPGKGIYLHILALAIIRINGENMDRIPKSASEKFNKSHSSLRSVVERSFGVWKTKWKIIGDPKYDLRTMCKIVVATMTLHNFIRDSNRADEDFCEFERNEDFVVESVHLDSDLDADIEPIQVDPHAVLQNHRYDPTGDAYMLGIRNDIAEQLWISRS